MPSPPLASPGSTAAARRSPRRPSAPPRPLRPGPPAAECLSGAGCRPPRRTMPTTPAAHARPRWLQVPRARSRPSRHRTDLPPLGPPGRRPRSSQPRQPPGVRAQTAGRDFGSGGTPAGCRGWNRSTQAHGPALKCFTGAAPGGHGGCVHLRQINTLCATQARQTPWLPPRTRVPATGAQHRTKCRYLSPAGRHGLPGAAPQAPLAAVGLVTRAAHVRPCAHLPWQPARQPPAQPARQPVAPQSQRQARGRAVGKGREPRACRHRCAAAAARQRSRGSS